MNLKADPPDFIDKGSYNVTDVSGWGSKAVGIAIGTAIAGGALMVGVGGARRLENEFSALTGMQTENNASGGNTIELV